MYPKISAGYVGLIPNVTIRPGDSSTSVAACRIAAWNLFGRPNHMIGRHHDHRRVGIVATHQQRGQADARGCVALARLADDRCGRQLGQLLTNGVDQPFVCDHHPSIIWCKVAKATNTSYAQGGIAAVSSDVDNFEKHINDTLIAGDGLCNRKVVEMVVREAPAQIQQLLKWGTDFDRETSGKFDLAREGGHSEHRIFHHKDNTGFEIQKVLTFSGQESSQY